MNISVLESVPLWIGALLFVVLLLAALEIGYRVGCHQREQWRNSEEGGGGLVLTTIMALLGLLLAFTFASGVSHYQTRQQAVIAEANAIDTAFLRADMVAEPGRTQLKQALLDYARVRAPEVGKICDPDEVHLLLEASARAKEKLWPITLQILQQRPPGALEASLVSAVNEVIDYYTVRVAAVFDRLPKFVLLLVVFITSASLAVAGFNAGISGRMSRWRMITLALAAVMTAIQDFDRPVNGFIRVSHDALHATIADMEADLAR